MSDFDQVSKKLNFPLQCVHILHFLLSILLIPANPYIASIQILSLLWYDLKKKNCYNLLLHVRIVSVGYMDIFEKFIQGVCNYIHCIIDDNPQQENSF